MSATVGRIGVVGAGTMGRAIAHVAAVSGFEVVLRSRSSATARRAVNELAHALGRHVARRRMTMEERATTLARVRTTERLEDLDDCALVVESVIEDLDAKLAVLGALDRACPVDTVLATNTSTLSIDRLAAPTRHPGRVCGLHFFNPVATTSVVEVVRGAATSDVAVDAGTRFVKACGKQSVVVADDAGFVVNALLLPMLNRAVRLLESGTASMSGIDTAMRGACGHPMGPFQLIDLIGVDTVVRALDALGEEATGAAVAPTLRELVAQGRSGRKSGRGFYSY